MKLGAALSAALLLAACATPPTAQRPTSAPLESERDFQAELLVQAYQTEWARYRRAALPIMIANADVCRRVGHAVMTATGLRVNTLYTWAPNLRTAAARVLGAEERPRVGDVPPRTPAERAGVMTGDVIVEFDGQAIGGGPDAIKRLDAILDAASRRGGAIPFVVERGRARLHLAVEPVEACRYTYRLVESQEVNAETNGDIISFARGMLRFATDEELPVVTGHELAHNVLRHVEAKQGKAEFGATLAAVAPIIGIPASATFRPANGAPTNQDFEREADYVGLYLTARGGFNIDAAPGFWRKMAIAFPFSMQDRYASTHPSTAARARALEEAVREIRARAVAGGQSISLP